MLARVFPTEKTDPELAPFRPGLWFGCIYALTWQIGIGTPMVLFCEQLGATPLEVGLAYSFVFLFTPLQIFATACCGGVSPIIWGMILKTENETGAATYLVSLIDLRAVAPSTPEKSNETSAPKS